MIEIGSTVSAKVTRIEVYGLYADVDGESLIVLIPEASWKDRRPLKDRFQVGEEIQAYVLRYNYKDRQIVGSIRRLHPETNPYRILSRLPPGTELKGTVGYSHGNEIEVALDDGTRGSFPRRQAPENLEQGDSILVTIADLEVEEGRMLLDLVRKLERKTNGVAGPVAEQVAGGVN